MAGAWSRSNTSLLFASGGCLVLILGLPVMILLVLVLVLSSSALLWWPSVATGGSVRRQASMSSESHPKKAARSSGHPLHVAARGKGPALTLCPLLAQELC